MIWPFQAPDRFYCVYPGQHVVRVLGLQGIKFARPGTSGRRTESPSKSATLSVLRPTCLETTRHPTEPCEVCQVAQRGRSGEWGTGVCRSPHIRTARI